MKCGYCGASSPEGEHRCARCGRRLNQGASGWSRSSAVPAPMPEVPSVLPPPAERIRRPAAPQQPSLFDERPPQTPRVIPFDSIPGAPQPPVQRQHAPTPPPRAPLRRPTPRRTPRKAQDQRQGNLEFLPPLPQPRTLRTSVQAAVYCDAPVAPRVLRAGAVVLDSLVVALGLLIFFGIFHSRGGELVFTKPALFIYAAVFVLTFLFYRVLACLLAGETPGTAWMGLQLLHFDGRPADRQQRIFRLISGCLSVLPAGAGLLWALADEERLTWHDHMSKTFATPR